MNEIFQVFRLWLLKLGQEELREQSVVAGMSPTNSQKSGRKVTSHVARGLSTPLGFSLHSLNEEWWLMSYNQL